MKLSRRDLNILIENYLHEGEFGSISSEINPNEPMFERCDLSNLPEIFIDFFEAVRNKDSYKVQKALDKQIALSNNPEEIARLMEKKAELDSPGFWEKFAKHGFIMSLGSLFIGGLSLFGLINKADCDAIIRKAEIYVEHFLIPTFGLDSERLKQQRLSRRKSPNKENIKNEKDNENKIVPSVKSLFENISLKFREANIIDVDARNKIQYVVIDSRLPSYYFDLFELFSPNEYINFVNNEKKEIPASALVNFQNALKVLRENGKNSFISWSDSFALATPGISTDKFVQNILKSVNWQEYFKDPNQLTQHIAYCLNQLIRNKNLNFADVGLMTNVS